MAQLKRDDTMPAFVPFPSPMGGNCPGGLVGEMEADLARGLAQQYIVGGVLPDERPSKRVTRIVPGVTGSMALLAAYGGVAVVILH